MDKFIRHLNIQYYQRQLAKTTDGEYRETLLKLLAEEEAKEPPPQMAK
jgi:hypothetical protein